MRVFLRLQARNDCHPDQITFNNFAGTKRNFRQLINDLNG